MRRHFVDREPTFALSELFSRPIVGNFAQAGQPESKLRFVAPIEETKHLRYSPDQLRARLSAGPDSGADVLVISMFHLLDHSRCSAHTGDLETQKDLRLGTDPNANLEIWLNVKLRACACSS